MTLQLYILRQILTALVFAVGGMLVIAIPGMAVGAIQRLGGAFIGPILGYLPLELVDLVPYFLPIGFLLAIVATYGRLAADNEWTAMCAAGISPLRLLLPGLGVALVLGATSWYLATDVAPGIGLLKRQYRRSAAVQGIQTLAPGRTQIRLGRFYLSARFREDNDFREVIVNIPADDEQREEEQLLAERLSFEIEGPDVVVRAQGARLIRGNRDARVENITLRRNLDSLFGTDQSGPIKFKFLSSSELREALRDGRVPEKDRAAAVYHLHMRDARGATCLMFLLLGAPTGLFLRRGTQLGALASAVGYALVYYLLTLRVGESLSEQGTIPPWLGAWSSTILGGAAGLWMTWRLARR